MKDKVYAVISRATENCIAICANVEDALNIKDDYETRSKKREMDRVYDVKVFSQGEIESLIRYEWMDISTAIEITLKSAEGKK
ncbi:hypothetical protein [Rhizobium leguminosarum]